MSHRSIFFVTDNNLQITEAFRTLRTNLAFFKREARGKNSSFYKFNSSRRKIICSF